MRSGRNIIVDSTFADPVFRANLLEFLRSLAVRYIKGVWIKTPFEVCMARNALRTAGGKPGTWPIRVEDMHHMEQQLRKYPPHDREGGFDDLEIVQYVA